MRALETLEQYDLSSEIEKAITVQNITVLQELLQLEAPLDERGVFYLMTAIDNFALQQEESMNTIIIQKLLYFGADPLAEIPNNSYYLNPLNYALSYDHNDVCFKIFFNHLKQTNRLSEISLADAAKCNDPNVIFFLMHEGVCKDAESALKNRLEWFSDDDISVTEPIQYQCLKVLFNISRNSSLTLEPELIYYLLSLAIFNGDFKFAYNLYHHSYIKTIYSNEEQNGHWKFQLCCLLDCRHPFDLNNPDKYRVALITFMLQDSYINFNELMAIYDQNGNEYRAKINQDIVKIAKAVSRALYNAMTAFFNPLQNVFPALPITLRSKIAIFYLKNELNNLIDIIPDHLLQQILIWRAMRYFYIFFPRVINDILLVKISQAFHYFSENTKKNICEFLSNYRDFLYDVHDRCNFISQFSNLNLASCNGALAVKRTIESFIRIWISNHERIDQRLAGKNEVYDNIIVPYSLNFLIKTENITTVVPMLRNINFYKTLTDNDEVKKLVQILIKNSAVFPVHYGNKYMFLHYLFRYYLNNRKDETILQVVINERDLHNPFLTACIEDDKLNLFKHIFQQVNFSDHNDYTELAKRAINCQRKNIFLQIFNRIVTYSSEEVLDFCRDLLRMLLMNKQFSMVNIILKIFLYIDNNRAKQCFKYVVERIMLEEPTIRQYIEKNIFRDKKLNSEEQNTAILGFFSINPFLYFFPSNLDNFKSQIYEITLRKIAYLSLEKFFKNATKFTCQRNENYLKKLTQNNDRKLINSLQSPKYLPLALYDSLMVEKGIDSLTTKPQILSYREKLLYLTLINAEWKLTHFVKNENDLEKILNDKEIRSISYRKRLGVLIDNQHTPGSSEYENFVYTTIGPKKSPCPSFLNKCGGFEIDINELLKKHPHFLQFGYATFHLVSFSTRQKFSPRNFKGSPWVISHTQDEQHHEFYLNDEKFELVNNLEEGIFAGNKIIHTLIMLFIKLLRCLPNSYEDALNNCANIDVLSDLFCEILHPGIIEFRYPVAIPIEESYTRIIPFQKTKYFSENELSNCLQSIDSFQIAIKNGLSANQQIILRHNSITYIGNVFTYAVLGRKNEIVDYILENNIAPIFERDILSPVKAAQLIHDNEMVVKLLCHGTNHNYGIRTLSPLILEDLQTIINSLDTNNILFIFKHCYYFDKLNFLKLFARKIVSCEHKSNIDLSLFAIILSELFNSINEEELMTFFLRMRNEALIRIVVDRFLSSSYAVKQVIKYFNHALILGLISTCEQFINGAFYHLRNCREVIYFLGKLAITGNIASLRNALQLCFPERYYDIDKASLEQLIAIYLDEAGASKENDWGMLDYCLTKIPGNFIEPSSIKILIHVIKNHNFFNKYYQALSCENTLVLLKHLNSDLVGGIKFILDHEHKKKEYILLNYVQDTRNYGGGLILVDLLVLLKCFPIALLKLIDNSAADVLPDTAIPFIVDFATHSFVNYKVKKMLIRIFLKNDITNKAFYLIMKCGSAEKLARFLFFIFDNLIFLENYHFNISKECEDFIRCNIHFLIELFDKFKYFSNRGLRLILNELLNTFDLTKEMTEKIISQVDLLNPDLPQNLTSLRKNSSLANKEAVAIFLTQYRNKDLYVYMGRKKQSITTDLIAPGGYIEYGELPLVAAIREANEETQLNFKLSNMATPSARDAVRCFKLGGEFDGDLFLDSQTELPAKMTFLHKYKRIDSFKEPACNFTLFIFWFELAKDKAINLSSSDDFTDGTWISATNVKYCQYRHGYYDNELKISTSNALLLEMIQGRQISKTVVDEEIFTERCARSVQKQSSHRFFNSCQSHLHKKARISHSNDVGKPSP